MDSLNEMPAENLSHGGKELVGVGKGPGRKTPGTPSPSLKFLLPEREIPTGPAHTVSRHPESPPESHDSPGCWPIQQQPQCPGNLAPLAAVTKAQCFPLHLLFPK